MENMTSEKIQAIASRLFESKNPNFGNVRKILIERNLGHVKYTTDDVFYKAFSSIEEYEQSLKIWLDDNLARFIAKEVENESTFLFRMIEEMQKLGVSAEILANVQTRKDELDDAFFYHEEEFIKYARWAMGE